MTIEVDTIESICKIEGEKYPAVGFGTYRLTGSVCTAAIIDAVKAGYRLFDTATYYENFDAIAKALKSLNRNELYISSKAWHDMHAKKNLRKDLEHTLRELRIDHIDGYFLHWPNSKIPIEESLGTMSDLIREGKMRHIGLSNVTVNHLKRALECHIPITWVQVEMHPDFYDVELLSFCKKHGIVMQAWRPLNYGLLKDNELLKKIALKHHKTISQIALKWIVQHGSVPIPSSKDPMHMKENLDIFDFSLSHEEMKAIDEKASKGSRYRIGIEHGLGFTDEFDFTYEECWPNR